MPASVLVVDDSEIFNKSLSKFLQGYPEVRIVAMTDDLKDAVRLCEELKPDVALVDLRLATGWNSQPFDIECLRNQTQLIAITFSFDEESREIAEKLGAVRIVDKMAIPSELVPTILEVAQQTKSESA